MEIKSLISFLEDRAAEPYKDILKEMQEFIKNYYYSLSNEDLLKAINKVYELVSKNSDNPFIIKNYLEIQELFIELLNNRGIEIPPNPYKQ